jgi:membrane associated rhomboid family serine protease
MARGIRLGWLRFDTVAAKLALALVVGSVLFALTQSSFGGLMLLFPGDVLHLWYLWQPVTYIFVARDPMGVIFGALILWQIGAAMEASWGSRRLLWFSFGVPALAGVLTVGLSLAVSRLQFEHFAGVWVLATAIWVAFGLSHGQARVSFWGLPVSGNTFALIGAGFVLLSGAFYGWLSVIPDLFGIALTVAYVKGASPRLLWLRWSSWRLQRQLKGRSRHLRVVTKDRNIGGGSDGYLH